MKLSEFLKEQKCYDEFVLNFKKRNNKLFEHDWGSCDGRLIFDAFIWAPTIEGRAYWEARHDAWTALEVRENDMMWLVDGGEETTIEPQKEYMVFASNGSKPKKIHETFKDANEELVRVMKQPRNINSTGYVLEIKSICKSSIRLEWD